MIQGREKTFATFFWTGLGAPGVSVETSIAHVSAAGCFVRLFPSFPLLLRVEGCSSLALGGVTGGPVTTDLFSGCVVRVPRREGVTPVLASLARLRRAIVV